MATNLGDRLLELAGGFIKDLWSDILAWCEGRNGFIRLPLLIFFAYIGMRQFADPMYCSIFSGINIGIHEGGHLVFQSFGRFICVAGGTFLQLLAPTASMLMFLKQRDYFAITICFGWLSTNIFSVSVYMADAEVMKLPLLTVGESGGIVTHDWRFLFTKLGLLSQCEAIGWLTRQLGNLSMLICLVGGAWLIWRMIALRNTRRGSMSR